MLPRAIKLSREVADELRRAIRRQEIIEMKSKNTLTIVNSEFKRNSYGVYKQAVTESVDKNVNISLGTRMSIPLFSYIVDFITC